MRTVFITQLLIIKPDCAANYYSLKNDISKLGSEWRNVPNSKPVIQLSEHCLLPIMECARAWVFYLKGMDYLFRALKFWELNMRIINWSGKFSWMFVNICDKVVLMSSLCPFPISPFFPPISVKFSLQVFLRIQNEVCSSFTTCPVTSILTFCFLVSKI